MEACDTLSRRYLPVAWRYAYALLQNRRAAEDVVGEAMLALVKNMDQMDAEQEVEVDRLSVVISWSIDFLEH